MTVRSMIRLRLRPWAKVYCWTYDRLPRWVRGRLHDRSVALIRRHGLRREAA